MLVKIVIENFKNFQVEQTLGLYEADEDSSAFTILVGKNGAGKSSTLDALEWVVFNKSSNTMRASKRDDLICFGKDYARVEAVFVDRVEGMSLSITRLHQRGGKTTSTAVLRSIREDAKFDIIRKLHGIDEISNVLQSQFKIDVTNIERILIKQQNASSIACTAPKQLLKYLETFTGSDKIDMAANNHLLNSMDITAELSDVLIAREELLVAIKDMQPNVDAATALKTEQKQLNEDFRRLFAAELRILELSAKMTAESLRFVKDEHKSILKNIQSACAIFDTLISSLRDLKSAERNTVQACHHCDEIISDAEEQLRKLIDDREFILQEEAKKSKKIKGLKKLVSIYELHFIKWRCFSTIF